MRSQPGVIKFYPWMCARHVRATLLRTARVRYTCRALGYHEAYNYMYICVYNVYHTTVSNQLESLTVRAQWRVVIILLEVDWQVEPRELVQPVCCDPQRRVAMEHVL